MQNAICKIILIITAIYLEIIESTAIIKRKLAYLDNLSKLFSIITPIAIMLNVVSTKTEETSFWTIQTWAALFVWFRFLLYLRTVTAFSWIVRMIQECVKDMLTFLVVLLIGVIAFADAFESIERILVITEKIPRELLDDDAGWYERYAVNYVKNW